MKGLSSNMVRQIQYSRRQYWFLYRFFGKFFLTVVLVMVPFMGTAGEELPVNFVGICTGDRVNVRAGADLNFEVLTQLDKGDKIIVLGKDYDWYKIKIPLKVDCFVHSDYLEVETERAKVKGELVNVRTGAGDNYSVLGQLKSGDMVMVRGIEGDWCRINPPEGCFVWVNHRYVKYYSTLGQFQIEQEQEHQRQDIFQKLEKDYRQELDRPLLEAGFSALLEEYKDFLVQYPHCPEAETVKARLEALNLKISEADYQRAKKMLEAKINEIEQQHRQRREDEVLPPPTATGQIDDLGMIVNRPGTHKLLDSGRIIYYLRSDKIDLNKYVYYPVRVWGKVVHLPDWDKPVIEVEMVRPVQKQNN